MFLLIHEQFIVNIYIILYRAVHQFQLIIAFYQNIAARMIQAEPTITAEVYEQFTLFYNQDVPNSLVALQNPAYVHCLFERREFVWLIADTQQKQDQPAFIVNLIDLLNQKEGSMISKMSMVQLKSAIAKQGNKEQAYDATNDIKGKNYFSYKKPAPQSRKYIVFGDITKSSETLWNLGRFSCVQQIVFYSTRNLELSYKQLRETIKQVMLMSQDKTNEEHEQYELAELNDDYTGLEGEQLYLKLFPSSASCQLVYTSDIVALLRSRRADSYFEKITPNFVSLVRQVHNSNFIKKMIQALIRQSQDIHREIVIKQFVKLVKHICPQSETSKIDDFILDNEVNSYKKLKASKILAMYTDESFFHKFINKMLRSSNNPLQIFYLTPVFMDLFEAIKELYQIQKQQANQSSIYKKQFICYRGAYFKDQQLQNFMSSKNDYIESLGFLSTTLSKQSAISMAINTLMIINVHDVDRDSNTDYGYAFIEQFSHYNQEKEILFNPLNSFKIEEIQKPSEYPSGTETKQLYTIVATYGKLSEIISKKTSNLNQKQEHALSQSEQNMYAVAVEQKNNQKQIYHQGNILLDGPVEVDCQLYYAQRRLQLQKQLKPSSKSKLNESLAYFQLGRLYFRLSSYNESIEYCYKADQTMREEYGQHYYQRVAILDLVAACFVHTDRYRKSIEVFTQIKQIIAKNQHKLQNQIDVVILMINQAHVLYKLQKYREGLQLLGQAQKMYRTVFKDFNNTETYARLVAEFANGHLQFSNFREALRSYNHVLEFRAVINGQNDIRYIETLQNIGLINLRLQKCEQSYQNFKQSLRLRSKINKKHNKGYLSTLLKIGHVLQNMTRYNEALTYYQECKNLESERQEKVNNLGYADAVRSIAGVHALKAVHTHKLQFVDLKIENKEELRQEHIDQCIMLHKECIQIYMRVLSSNPLELAKRLFQIPKLYPWFNMNQSAIFIYQQCRKIFEKHKDQCWVIYGECLNYLSKLYLQQGRFEQARQHILENINIIIVKLGTNNLQYAQTLLNAALMYRTIKNYRTAIQYNNEVYNVVKHCINQTNSPDGQLVGHQYAIFALRQLAQIYNQIGIEINPLDSKSQHQCFRYLNHSIVLYNLCIRSELKRTTDTKSDALGGFLAPNSYNKIYELSYERDLVFKNLIKYQRIEDQFAARMKQVRQGRKLQRVSYIDLWQ